MSRKFDNIHQKDAEAHLVSFNDYCVLQGLTRDDQKMSRFCFSLEGSPRKWLNSVNPRNWEECKSMFIKLYDGHGNYLTNLQKFRTFKYDESKIWNNIVKIQVLWQLVWVIFTNEMPMVC